MNPEIPRKTLLLFGSTGSLGKAVGNAFLRNGWSVVACNRTKNNSDIENEGSDPKNTNPTNGSFTNSIGSSDRGNCNTDHIIKNANLLSLQYSRDASLTESSVSIIERVKDLIPKHSIQASVCCCGSFGMAPIMSDTFLSEAENLLENNCHTSLRCIYTSLNLFSYEYMYMYKQIIKQYDHLKQMESLYNKTKDNTNINKSEYMNKQRYIYNKIQNYSQQKIPPLLLLCGAAAVLQHQPTPDMLAYGGAKVYVHHLIKSLGAAADAAMVNTTKNYNNHVSSENNETSSNSSGNSSVRSNSNALPSFRICGVAPVMLDTPANRIMIDQQHQQQQQEQQLLQQQQHSVLTNVNELAERIVRIADGIEVVPNGHILKV